MKKDCSFFLVWNSKVNLLTHISLGLFFVDLSLSVEMILCVWYFLDWLFLAKLLMSEIWCHILNIHHMLYSSWHWKLNTYFNLHSTLVQGCNIAWHIAKGCLSLFNYLIDMSPTLMSPFFFEKTRLKKKVLSTKNGLINMGRMSIKLLNKERQPLVALLCSHLRGHS
jgi:hypothetical protein